MTVIVVAQRPAWQTAALAWWAACAVALAFIDALVHRLPDRLTFPAAAGTVALLGVGALAAHDGGFLVRAVLAGVSGTAMFALLTVLLGRRGGYGLGDAKLMLSTGTVLGSIGWNAVVVGLVLAWTAQGLLASALLVTRRATRSTSLPFGPFLVGGALAAIAWLG